MLSPPVTGRTPPRRRGREQAPAGAAVAPPRCQRGDEIPENVETKCRRYTLASRKQFLAGPRVFGTILPPREEV